jgi:hypothetical protein
MSYDSTADLTISANNGNNAINLLYNSFKTNSKTCFVGNITDFQFVINPKISNLNNYYYLPYTSTSRLLIVFGQIEEQGTGVVNTFGVPFSSIPYVFAQQFSNDGGDKPTRITSVTTTTFTCDPQYGGSNKGPYMFFAIGLAS